MARIDYNGPVASDYEAGRGAPPGGLDGWRAALGEYLPTASPVLDVGAGTGLYARLIHDWFDQRIIALEPATRMLSQAAARSPSGEYCFVAGRAEHIPIRSASCGAAWLSTMIHHVENLPAAAAELRRVLRPDAPVLIRSVFPGNQSGIALYRYFPAAARVVDTFPSVADVASAFGAAGFSVESLTGVFQANAASLGEFYEKARHRANTTLLALSDAEFSAGLEALRVAAHDAVADEPVISRLDLLVLR